MARDAFGREIPQVQPSLSLPRQSDYAAAVEIINDDVQERGSALATYDAHRVMLRNSLDFNAFEWGAYSIAASITGSDAARGTQSRTRAMLRGMVLGSAINDSVFQDDIPTRFDALAEMEPESVLSEEGREKLEEIEDISERHRTLYRAMGAQALKWLAPETVMTIRSWAESLDFSSDYMDNFTIGAGLSISSSFQYHQHQLERRGLMVVALPPGVTLHDD